MQPNELITFRAKLYKAIHFDGQKINGDKKTGRQCACDFCDLIPEDCKGVECIYPEGVLYLKQIK